MSATTESITDTARAFFDACETGKGWAECSTYCHPHASFAAQAEPLAGRISHMTKIWNVGWAMRELGWIG